MSRLHTQISVVGGGLAGSECAYQLAEMGHKVVLFEMRGGTSGDTTPAHKTNKLSELVCSNSFGSTTDYSAPGQLKWEAEQLGSLILSVAKSSAVPAGMALGIDREVFASEITARIAAHPNIEIRREVVESLDSIPRPAVICSGPLTGDSLAASMREHFDGEFLYFFDAIAPIIDADSINTEVAFKAARWDKGGKDYWNCPMSKEQYYNLISEIKAARKIEPKEFEKDTPYFEGCMPVEAIVERGDETLRFGPMSAKGLFDNRVADRMENNPELLSGRKPYAVVQLRQDNREGTAFNMVGFQTKMAYGEQQRVFRMIPGLEKAEFLKLGSIHRNLYIQTPKKLSPVLCSKKDEWLFFAGQITGVEGYFDSTCMGLLVAHFLNDKLSGREISRPPRESAFGSLLNAITEDNDFFQPTNINFGLFPNIAQVGKKKEWKEKKREMQIERAKVAMRGWLSAKGIAEVAADAWVAPEGVSPVFRGAGREAAAAAPAIPPDAQHVPAAMAGQPSDGPFLIPN